MGLWLCHQHSARLHLHSQLSVSRCWDVNRLQLQTGNKNKSRLTASVLLCVLAIKTTQALGKSWVPGRRMYISSARNHFVVGPNLHDWQGRR